MNIENITGLEKPLVKLIETIGEGVGTLGNHFFEFDAKKIERVGKAEAETKKQEIIKKAEGEEQALITLNRANKRFALLNFVLRASAESKLALNKRLFLKFVPTKIVFVKMASFKFVSDKSQ